MPRTILLVEDNELFRGMLQSLLEIRGYTIFAARNGADGLAIASAHPVHGALVDVDMPEIDGFEFCRQFRAQEAARGRDVPVWIMTGVFRPALEKRAAAAGALLVVRKPFPIDEVCGRLEAEFEKRAAQPPPLPETGAGTKTE